MPLFAWVCNDCSSTGRKLAPKMPELPPCPKCGGKQSFSSEATSRIIEVRDNGVMTRKVEQLANIQDLIKNR